MLDTAIHDRISSSPETTQQLDTLVTNRPGGDQRPRSAPGVTVEESPASGQIPLLPLTDAIAFGLRDNPRLRVAREAISRAQGMEQVAFAPFLPTVDLYTRVGISSATLSPGAPGPVGGILATGDGAHQYWQAETDLQWTLWDFGRTAGRYNQAITRERIAELQFVRARQTVAFDVITAYMSVLLAKASRRVQEQSIHRAQAVLDDSRARRLGGVANLDDVLRAEVQLSEAREALTIAQQAEFDALARLNYTMGRNVSLPLQVVDYTSQPSFEKSLVECLENAAMQRQEVAIAREAVAGAGYGLDATRGDFYPRIYIRGGVGHIDGDGVRTGWNEGAAIHLDQQFYAGGRRQGEQRAAEAELRSAAAEAQTVFDTVSLEVNLAFRAVTATFDRIRLTEPTVEQARENLRLVRVKYKNANATPTDVVDAETTLTRSQQRYYSAVYDYLAALGRMEYVMGAPPASLIERGQDGKPAEQLPPPQPLVR